MLCKRCGQLSTKIFVYAFKLHSIDATLLNFFLSYLLVFFYVGIFSCFQNFFCNHSFFLIIVKFFFKIIYRFSFQRRRLLCFHSYFFFGVRYFFQFVFFYFFGSFYVLEVFSIFLVMFFFYIFYHNIFCPSTTLDDGQGLDFFITFLFAF